MHSQQDDNVPCNACMSWGFNRGRGWYSGSQLNRWNVKAGLGPLAQAWQQPASRSCMVQARCSHLLPSVLTPPHALSINAHPVALADNLIRSPSGRMPAVGLLACNTCGVGCYKTLSAETLAGTHCWHIWAVGERERTLLILLLHRLPWMSGCQSGSSPHTH